MQNDNNIVEPVFILEERSIPIMIFINIPFKIAIYLFLIAFYNVIDNFFTDIFILVVMVLVSIPTLYDTLFHRLVIYENTVVIERYLVPNYINHIDNIKEVKSIDVSKIPFFLGVEFISNNNFIFKAIKNKTYYGAVMSVSYENIENIKKIIKTLKEKREK